MTRALLVLVLLIVVGVLCVGAFLYFYQNKLIFFPSVLARDFRYQFPRNFTEGFLPTETGEVNYLRFHVEQPRGVLLFFHGNAGALDSWGHVAAELAERTGFEVWIFDYPGYGKSTGPIPSTEKGFLEVGHSLLALIRSAHPALPVFLYGRSIGSGIAGRLSTEVKTSEAIGGLILETPYTSLRSLAREIVWWVPSFLVRFDLDNRVLAKAEAKVPRILLFHGTEDSIIPHHHSVQLEKHLAGRAKLVIIPGGQHNDLSASALYWDELISFLKGSKP